MKFCHKLGLSYVSCSPYRVPVARLAAAQAAIEEKRKGANLRRRSNRLQDHQAAPGNRGSFLFPGLANSTAKRIVPAMNSYAATLEALEALPLEEQESVLEIMNRRLTERRRAELIATVKQSRKEQAAGKCKPASVASIMRQVKP